MIATMELNALKTIFDACKSFVIKDDSRPVYKSVQLNFSGGYCTAYALDGIKMMEITVPCNGDVEGSMLVPIIKLPKGDFVILTDEGNEIIFDFLDSKQTVKKYAGEFIHHPDTLFPTGDPTFTIHFSSKNLKAALDGFKDERVRLDFFGPLKACVLSAPVRRALVFPLKLDK